MTFSNTFIDTAQHATLIAAPSSIKNKDKARDPEMHSNQQGNQWYFGVKAHIGVGAGSGLLHGHEKAVGTDASYLGVDKRPGANPAVTWHVAMRQGKRQALQRYENALKRPARRAFPPA